MRGILRKAEKLLRSHGFGGSIRLVGRRFYGLVYNHLPQRRRYLRDYEKEQLDFDRELNVRTWRIVELKSLLIDSPNVISGTDYDPSPVRFVKRFFDHLPYRFESFTFIDLGSGLGRSVFVAAREFPFRRVIGVEFSEDLHRGALENLASCRRDRLKCSDIEFICCDAGQYRFPPGPLIVHLFNPFGPVVLQPVLDRLATTTEDCYILYRNSTETRPECLAVFERSRGLRCDWSDNAFSIWVRQPMAVESTRPTAQCQGAL